MASASTTEPRVIRSEDLSPNDAKWVTLKKLTWVDPNGKERPWEVAERTTRAASGIDAVAVLALIRPPASKKGAYEPSTVLVEQYRPPVRARCVELPAGLIDGGETPEHAAVRELREETGFEVTEKDVVHSSTLMVSDPGMTNANMKLVVVRVEAESIEQLPLQHLDEGEFITRRIVALKDLSQELKAYEAKGFAVDARLAHFAAGYDLATNALS
ncbi:NUDIX hydrolase domain-like protein [Auriculariales sp. MPI-PUGE-AT-0066]|nr:NUDIX hydrolase domain-like protein [Auriculariales sp. MPI-PUGE-AT-0066]